MEFLTRMFDSKGFPARWQCGTGWSESPWLGWVHILSDLGIWSAYLAIPIVLMYFLMRRKDLPFRGILVLFGAFILACGTTHLMEAIIFWWPAYRLAGVIKLVTAIISWTTVFSLFQVVPRALSMRSPGDLEREIAARIRAEQELHRVNSELEEHVARRTADLTSAADALRDERELLRTTLGSIAEGVIVTDVQGRIVFLNGVAEELTGWTAADARGQRLEKVFHVINERTRQPVESMAIRALRGSVILGLANQTVLKAKNGIERPIEDSAAPIQGKVGAIRGVVLIFRDVTDRKRTEQALRQSELREKERAEELEAVLRATPTPIWISHDPECRYVTGNPASYRLLGSHEGSNVSATAAEPTHRTFREVRNGQPVAGRELPLQKAAMEGVDVRGAEISFQFEDGHVRHLYGNASPIRSPDGMVRGAVAALVDITEIKNSEQALKDADRRKDEFLATLAHELRNPLAPIRNSLEVMKRSNGNLDIVQKSRMTMERQLGQLVRLVDDLIDVSRISRNKLELRRERIELDSVLQHVIEACRPVVEDAGHEFVVDMPTEPIVLNADPIRLAQVFGNLITNACRYTNRGGRIRLSAVRDGDDAVITVADSGIGIPADMLNRIFEMFIQLDVSSERSQGGLGIGLTLVKRLVELHNGSVSAHSKGPGQGSQFVVRLPVLCDHPAIESKPADSVEEVTVARRILVVDDNLDSAATLSMLLEMTGNEVQTAGDGLEAVDKATRWKPDMILLDIGLPKMSGYAVCQAIRNQPWGRDIFIVALSGWGQPEDRRKSKEAGFDEHLVKPVEHAVLLKLMKERYAPCEK